MPLAKYATSQIEVCYVTELSASPHVYTARWGAHRDWPPGVLPVRISIGLPRFLPRAAEYPDISDLMPWGLFKINAYDEFAPKFIARLDRKGVDLIQQQFDWLHESYPDRVLMLLCYEDLRKPREWCHRRVFARWWFERTGAAIHDLDVVELGVGPEVPFEEIPSGDPHDHQRGPAPEPEPPPPSLF